MTRPPHDSYWVLPGRLLAGPYPGALDPAEAQAKVADFLAAGVTVFLDLTEDGELEPYAHLLRGADARHVRHPIRDASVSTEAEMRRALDDVRTAVDRGDVVYVHCWGGMGRTGTLVGCLLREDGTAADAVLDRVRELRRDTGRAHRPSPETPEQRAFVARWPSEPAAGARLSR